MRIALAWQPGLTYGNGLTLIINNPPPKKKKKKEGKKKLTNNTCKTLPRPGSETEGKHIRIQTETVRRVRMNTQTHIHMKTNVHTQTPFA